MAAAYHLKDAHTLVDINERVIFKMVKMDEATAELEQDIRLGYQRYAQAPGNRLHGNDTRHQSWDREYKEWVSNGFGSV